MIAFCGAGFGAHLPAAAATPFSGSPISLPGTFEAENFDRGGEGQGYHDNVRGNAGGQYRTSEDVDIISSSDSAGGGYVVNNFEIGEWLAYSVNVPANGTYDIELRLSNNYPGAAFRVEIDGRDVTGTVPVSNTGGWSSFRWVGKKGIPLTAGAHTLKIVAVGQYFNLNQVRVTQVSTSGGTSGDTGGTTTPPPPTGSLPSTGTRAVPTYESASLYWTSPGSGAGNGGCQVKFRKQGETAWRDGLALWYDSRNAECRGSLVHLEPGTDYEAQLNLPGQPASRALSFRTWSNAKPVARTVTVPGGSQTLTISEGGSPNGYVVYQAASGSTLNANNSAANNVVINASYVILRGFKLTGARQDAIKISPSVTDVIIEDNDISVWGRQRSGSLGVDRDAAIKAVCSSGTLQRVTIQRNRIHSPRYTTNSWSSGHPQGPQGIDFNECGGGNFVFRHNDIVSGNGNWYNDGIGGGENFSTTAGFPGPDTDIYGNRIENAQDDGIEAEGPNRNVRIWGNYINNTYTGVASTATTIGPLYVFRNVIDRSVSGNVFSKSGTVNGSGRRYLMHNTLLQSGGANGMGYAIGGTGSSQLVTNTVSTNNVYHVRSSSTVPTYQIGSGNQFNNDMVPSGNEGGGATNTIRGVPVYSNGGGQGMSGIYTLATNSPGFDRGVRIPNFNDGYSGAAPDVGAHEAGSAQMKFGVAAGGSTTTTPPTTPTTPPTTPPPPAGSTPYSGTPVSLPATFEAENFDKGGEGVAYHDNVKGNAGGQYRTAEDVDIIPDPAGSGYVVNNFENGEWMTYTVNVPAAGSYDIELRVSSSFSTSAFHVELNGQDVTGRISVPNTGGWSSFQWIGKKGVSLPAGKHVLKIVADQQYFNLNQVRVVASGGTSTPTNPTPTEPTPTEPVPTEPVPTTKPASLLFWSGFEGTTATLPVQSGDCWNNGCWGRMGGSDGTTGFNWPPKVNGGDGMFQMLNNAGSASPSTISNWIVNRVENVTGRKGISTRAMYTGIHTLGGDATQDPFMLLPSQDIPEMYISQWVKLQPDMFQKMAAGTWRDLFEWKTTDTDFRVELAMVNYGGGTPYWQIRGDGWIPSYQEFWRVTNKSVPIPVGQWFKLEVYWKRGTGTDGRVWMAVNGQTIVDKRGNNFGPNRSRINRVMVNTVYGGHPAPQYQWVDDLQIWSTFPSATQGQAWYDPPYAPR